MPALTGDLAELGCADVLRFLAATGKTGCLRVEGHAGQGSVWVRDGDVVAAAQGPGADREPPGPIDEVLCALLRHESGSFSFDPAGPPAPNGDTGAGTDAGAHRVEDLLPRAWALLDEWQVLHEVIPSLDLLVRMVEVIPDGEERTVTADQWPVLVAIGRECTVSALADRLGVSELGVLRLVHALLAGGIASLSAPRPGAGRARRAPVRSR